ncbi:peptidoglycan-binding protein [Pedobacter sp. MC2016-14]|uniref:peptidoglycan-binding protein n=1 Tax=Pedobacter sp. MC2016-14 TaxID=2897327 RepID=UPI001E5FDC88|nr:peptidoglycan-binding protein [Pedobacter sp. MC2016-14]MCD0486965.1 peptidoglycan-binding protein [Pedobacter sp. MC2016-14]
METTKFLLVFIWLAAAGGNRLPDGNLLAGIAKAEIGVRELSGHNDGQRVAAYQKAGDCTKGDPWCAAFISWVFKQAGYPAPRTGWSPNLFPSSRVVKVPERGTVLGIYFPALKRIAHCGLVTGVHNNWVYSVEGNTNVAGSREGDGVYARIRHRKSISRYADWMKKKI